MAKLKAVHTFTNSLTEKCDTHFLESNGLCLTLYTTEKFITTLFS